MALCLCVLCAESNADPDDAVVVRVNRVVNHRIAFMSDIENWGVPDYWATPDEAYARGAGDCEDIAIAKFFALRAAGLPAKRVRLVYTELIQPGADGLRTRHIVVAYLAANGAPGSEAILDNLIDEIRPVARRPDLHVLLSFDTEDVWRGLERGSPARAARAIKPWARVLDRMAAEP